MINFLLNVLACIVAIEIRHLLIKILKVYKLKIIIKNTNDEVFNDFTKKDFV